MDDSFQTESESEDLSYSDLDIFPEFLLQKADNIKGLQLDHNEIAVLPRCISVFRNLIKLDISNNHMSYLSPELTQLTELRTLCAKNNLFMDEALPKDLGRMRRLQVVNFSGNNLTKFPIQCTELLDLRALYLGANAIESVPTEIKNLSK